MVSTYDSTTLHSTDSVDNHRSVARREPKLKPFAIAIAFSRLPLLRVQGFP